MRVLIFHGYLLRGTGSNIYNLSLARALAGLGHEVHLVCQERHPAGLHLPEAITVHNPDIGRILPVYVADEYVGFDAVPFLELSDEDLKHYLDANVEAVAEVVRSARPDVALANHLVMGPAILHRALGTEVPYAVKVHGSALEYTVRPAPARFLPYATEGLSGARCVLVGSLHTAKSLWEVVGDDRLPARTRLGPPGVDVHAFRPRPVAEAGIALERLAGRLEGADAAGWGGETGAAEALRSLDPGRDRIVSYVGKLIVSKGVDLLLAAWPLVVAQVPDARLCVVGFGTYRATLGDMVEALTAADLEALRTIAARGRELEGGPAGELSHLAAFLDGLEGGRREAYLAAAGPAAQRVVFTGRLEHEDLPDLLSACEAQVVPSTFPEAFGMVAAEAAACGALPLSAAHSGLAEVTTTLAGALERDLRDLLCFDVGPGAIEAIADRLVRWLTLPPGQRARAAASLADLARRTYGWESVADGVIAAAQGRRDSLPAPG
ncbi:MAG: glycosyltransferase family 4 protein [Thermoleophilaceae bacterium]|nr:glycosyltransferase family 4 protein [Thermoleophilaceae bacterium]